MQSLYNVHQSRIWFIGFSGSGLGLVKIILGQYISDWEAENHAWHTPICQLLFNIYFGPYKDYKENYGKLLTWQVVDIICTHMY
jgi:hypothetical protein